MGFNRKINIGGFTKMNEKEAKQLMAEKEHQEKKLEEAERVVQEAEQIHREEIQRKNHKAKWAKENAVRKLINPELSRVYLKCSNCGQSTQEVEKNWLTMDCTFKICIKCNKCGRYTFAVFDCSRYDNFIEKFSPK